MTSRGLFNHDWVFAAADHSNVHLPSESISCSTLILSLLGDSLPRSCRSRQLFNLLVSFSDFREAQESNIRLKSSFFSPSKFKDKRESLKILPQKEIFFNSNEGGFGQKSGRQNSVRPRGHNLSLSLSHSHGHTHSLALSRSHGQLLKWPTHTREQVRLHCKEKPSPTKTKFLFSRHFNFRCQSNRTFRLKSF